MKPSREAVLRVLRESKPALEQEFPVWRLALFGSVARDESR